MFRILDIRAVLHACYRMYYAEVSENFRNSTLEAFEGTRWQGYADAMNQLAADFEGVPSEDLEKYRIDAEAVINSTKTGVDECRQLGTITAMIRIYLLSVLPYIAGAIVVLAALLKIMPLLVIIPIIALAAMVQFYLCGAIITKRLTMIIYDYGYSEGIIRLTDKRHLHDEGMFEAPISKLV
ncbi:hypothetical protein IJG91_01270 [Candidatus Saccharibacteria bacterium]|nr:hypothetical protein [Candidatus Saccharibacteria bacterium]